jgi:hypothetical protein
MNEIFHRTSIRRYLDKPVENEKIESLHLQHVIALTAQCLSMRRLI